MSRGAASDSRRSARYAGVVGAVLVVTTYLLAVRRFAGPVNLRMWSGLGSFDMVAMVALAAPFLTVRWLLVPRSVATRIAWWICVSMTVDVFAFGVGILAPTGGHPSLEAVIAMFVGYAKIGLVPAALVLLTVASLRGERVLSVLLGSLCLISQTIYTLAGPQHPIRWLMAPEYRVE